MVRRNEKQQKREVCVCVIDSMQLRGREKQMKVCATATQSHSRASIQVSAFLHSQAFITAIERKDEREGGARDSRYLLLPELIM